MAYIPAFSFPLLATSISTGKLREASLFGAIKEILPLKFSSGKTLTLIFTCCPIWILPTWLSSTKTESFKLLILTISNNGVPGETTAPGSTIFLLIVPLIPALTLVSFIRTLCDLTAACAFFNWSLELSNCCLVTPPVL